MDQSPPVAKQILIVDDNTDSREMLAELIKTWGHSTTLAADGPSALEALAARQIDIVLLDIGLPGMNGYEVAERIRALPQGQELRIIALSGYGQPEDRRKSEAAGFNEHLVKPVDLDKLVRALDAVAPAAPSAVTPTL
jgi:CheY-like chemotaxis protein